MRFSVQSLTLCALFSQAFASPCKPLPSSSAAVTTTAGATSATSLVTEETSTLVVSEPWTTTTASEETTTIVVSEAPITTTLAELSTSVTLSQDEGTTTTLLTTLAEESTTTTVAATTTTSSPPVITNLAAVRTDNDETLETWLQPYNTYNHLTSDDTIASGHATFGLEPGTSRLYATFPDGSKLFAQTSFPNSNNYAFIFTTKENVDNLSWYDFITCSERADGYLDCQSETSHTPIYWYYADDIKLYYMEGSPTLFDYPTVKFKFVVEDA
ncbi:hypothetical protein FBEOM_9251 [Fusarium beomiforme]|uniref:Uncharacterized protein n=1 Tax=Fusarium beomiforme TaxID=44412 RepID=A0A9P5AE25_9HYPO|nr:hypothetical protein FBEOM_9251 [Fusarium beomiforme]